MIQKRYDSLFPTPFGSPMPFAIGVGLFIDKQAGIFAAVFLGDRSGFAQRPANASWLQI